MHDLRPSGAPDHGALPDPCERERMVAVAAYYLAEQRGFAPGREQDDWCNAEQQIDAMLRDLRHQGIDPSGLGHAALRNALRLRIASAD
ncbi:DUF2934 domain-containing protein [Thiohalocapsa marina]|uniref:DUF2934 domain-containing protein n=1 Tax=Thiohalocapsa marina TaxID=424902 RepID=A0A5M8FLC0_9GAMM|nr:DUF2934 domain-containing protein [Thiohalocapsa marina]KAA6185638.1 DUF2934 domain-containing protein [Thiohalocapsa marina]